MLDQMAARCLEKSRGIKLFRKWPRCCELERILLMYLVWCIWAAGKG